MENNLVDRLARLEKRVTALEGAPRTSPPDGPDRFWALDGLKARSVGAGAVLFTGSVALPDGRGYEWQQGFDANALLDSPWPDIADTLAALGHPVRLALVRAVLRGTGSAAELAATEGLGTTGQLYHHLRQLVAAGWLRSPARGVYEVPADRVVALLVVIAAGGA